MAAMDSLTVARSLRGSIGMLAMAWLLDESTIRRGAELGLTAEGMGGYAVGRLGVLGDCPIDNVVGAALRGAGTMTGYGRGGPLSR